LGARPPTPPLPKTQLRLSGGGAGTSPQIFF
jgi:hypothetical protein